MRKIYLTAIVLFIAAITYGKVIRVEYKKGINNTYKLEYTDAGDVYISNVINPIEGWITDGYWMMTVNMVASTGDPYMLVYKYLKPFMQSIDFPETDYAKDGIYLFLDISLDGETKNIMFSYSSRITEIPLSVIEQLEAEIKRKYQVVFKYNPDKIGNMQYIQIMLKYKLTDIKKGPSLELEPLPDRPVLVP